MYKRIAAIEDLKYKYDVEEELEDRFGQIPKATQNLIDIAYIKALASRLGFSQISMHGRSVRLKLANDRRLDNRVLMVILNENRDIIRYTGSNPYLFTLMLKEENGDLALTKVKTLLERIAELT
jgi:transcription-repair coupling factor (superfamily II helicase)